MSLLNDTGGLIVHSAERRLRTINKAAIFLNELGYFTVALAANITLLILIRHRTPRALKPYSMILTIHCISDLLNDLAMFIMGVQTVPVREYFFMISTGVFPNDYDPAITMIQCCMYLWIVIFVPVYLVTIDFSYRYLLICHQINLTLKGLLAYVFTVYFVTFLMACVAVPIFCIRTEPESLTDDERALLAYALNVDKLPPFGLAIATEFWTVFLMGITNMIIFGDYIYIVYVVRQISEKTKTELISTKTKNVNRQIAWIMAVQASIPLLLCAPTSLNVIACFTKSDWSAIGRLSCFLIPWLAALRPIATILIVPSYRNCWKEAPIFNTVVSTVSVSNYTTKHSNFSNLK